MRTPLSTYRLQVREGFTLDDIAEVADYIRDLGADWLYLSPLLKAAAGSDHGYDVVDHGMVDPARGGARALDVACRTAHALGLGVLIDVVPNHMGVAVPAENPWWWDVLAGGRGSRYAEAFDIDWEHGRGRLRIPVLDSPEDVTELRLADGVLEYRGNRYPLADRTDDGADPVTVHARQHYELIPWRDADQRLNYRRFFAVNGLAAIRVELDWVYEESHREILRWLREGLADGLRIDHPDGLADPGGYLERLAGEGCYLVVEKILEGGEQLPPTWPVAGTTGYDALGDIDRVLVDPRGGDALDALAERTAPAVASWPRLIHDTKRGVADGMLRCEVLRLERELRGPAGSAGADDNPTADALAELLSWFPVYRSYLPLGAEHLQEAAGQARRHRPELAAEIDALLPMLADPSHPAAIRFQQISGMVMAKGVEDTAFYRFTRLGSLTEVGADPAEFSIPVAEFHSRQQRRLAALPDSLTTLTTHDTKRGEDVRARLDVLSEIPEEWGRALEGLRAGAPLGDRALESLLWQAIVGAWPASRERLHAYAEKAAREAGSSTSWSDPDQDFERRMHALVDSAFDRPEAVAIIDRLLDRIRSAGWSNSLAAKLIQLTAPGIPDVYQGSELWEQSLVDPDNRRPVDFGQRRRMLAVLDAGELPDVDESGAAKLLVTSRALRLRRDHPELFTRYVPLRAYGPASAHLLAFHRGGAVTATTRLPLGLTASGGWRDTVLPLGCRPMQDVLTGRRFAGGPVPLTELFERYPVALLAPEGSTRSRR